MSGTSMRVMSAMMTVRHVSCIGRSRGLDSPGVQGLIDLAMNVVVRYWQRSCNTDLECTQQRQMLQRT